MGYFESIYTSSSDKEVDAFIEQFFELADTSRGLPLVETHDEFTDEEDEDQPCEIDRYPLVPDVDEKRSHVTARDAETEAALRDYAHAKNHIRFDRPVSSLEQSAFMVSACRFLIPRLGHPVASFMGHEFVTGAVLLQRIAGERGLRGFGRPKKEPKAKKQKRIAPELQALAEGAAALLADPFIERRILASADREIVIAYATLLVDEGPMTDTDAAKALHAPRERIEAARAVLQTFCDE